MKQAFLDTGYVLALELANDQNHRPVMEHWRRLTGGLPSLVTTSYVFDEIRIDADLSREYGNAHDEKA